MADSSHSAQEICQTVKEYILKEFLPGEEPESLTNDTPLISGGILDSIKVTKLVIFLEDTYGFEFEAHEITADYIDTLDAIVRYVQTKAEHKK